MITMVAQLGIEAQCQMTNEVVAQVQVGLLVFRFRCVCSILVAII